MFMSTGAIGAAEVAKDSNNYIAKIAVVDVESILENSLAIAHLREKINSMGEAIQKEIISQETLLKQREQELASLQKDLSEEEFNLRVAKFNKDVSAVQKNFKIKKLALEQAHAKGIEIVHKTTIIIISEMAKKYDFNVVLPSTHVLFVKGDFNITSEVLLALNERLREVPDEKL